MKNLQILALIALILAMSACTTGKVNYKIDDHGNMVVEKTTDGKFAIKGSASDASSEAAEYEKNMTVKIMYGKYLGLIEKGDFEGAKKLRIEIEVLRAKIPSTPDTPVQVTTANPAPEIKKAGPNEDPQTTMKRVAKRKKK